MNALICSDTHGNTTLLQQAVDIAQANHSIDAIWHLGDNYDDPMQVNRGGAVLYRVPGIWHPGYRSGMLDSSFSMQEEGIECLMIHDISEVSYQDRVMHQLICHGHTHRADISLNQGTVELNPGHLKCALDRGCDASFAVISMECGEMEITLYNLTGLVVDNRTFSFFSGKIVECSLF